MARSKGHRDLVVWQRAVDAAARCYVLAATFPPQEKYALADQIRRASVSIASNIAEGHGLHTPRAFIKHLRIARGSLAEVDTQIEIATRVGYATSSRVRPLIEELEEISRMLAGLIRSLDK